MKRDDVYLQLKEQILNGHFSPGETIGERATAESLGISRVPLREALIRLERDELVRIVPRRGAFVRIFSAEDLRHLYELREALEGMAAGRAALAARSRALDEIKGKLRSLIRGKHVDEPEAERLGLSFHETVLGHCGNPMIAEAAARIGDQVRLARSSSYQHASQDWVRRGVREHLSIAEAIESGDSAAAEREMRAHIAAWSRFCRGRLGGNPEANRGPLSAADRERAAN